MLALSKVDVKLYKTSVIVNATCDYKDETWPKCTVTIKGPAFRDDLLPIKNNLSALQRRASELANPKSISQLARQEAGERSANNLMSTQRPHPQSAVQSLRPRASNRPPSNAHQPVTGSCGSWHVWLLFF
jgi:hypothetical protein